MNELRIENNILNDQADSFQRICLEGQVPCVVFYNGDNPDKSNMDLANIFSRRGFKPYLVPEDFLIKGKKDLKIYEEIINISCLFIFYIDENRSSFLYCLGHIRAKDRPIITFSSEELLKELSSDYENEFKTDKTIYELDYNKLSEIDNGNNSLINFIASVEQSYNYVLKQSKDNDNISEIDSVFKNILEFLIPKLSSIFNDELADKLSLDIKSVTQDLFDYYFDLKVYEQSALSKYHSIKLKDKSFRYNPVYRTLINVIFLKTITYISDNLQSDNKNIVDVFEEFIKNIDEDEDHKYTVQTINNLNNKGIAYLILSFFKDRGSYLEKSFNIFDKLNKLITPGLLKSQFAATIINIALIYEYMSDSNPNDGYIDDSLDYLKDAEKMFEEKSNDFTYGLVLNSRAHCLRKIVLISKNTSELELSIEISNKAAKVFETNDHKFHKVTAIINKSISELYKSKITSNKQFCEDALNSIEEAFN
ncbi:MAG: hypothetical protein ACR2NW_05680, partial [Thermodesulfobacteriota bacterium]